MELASENMKKCEEKVLARIEDGLNLLTDERGEDKDRILKAFVLANRAMLYQRLHFTYALNNFKNKKKKDWPNAKKTPTGTLVSFSDCIYSDVITRHSIQESR